jgi:hypothetical protein
MKPSGLLGPPLWCDFRHPLEDQVRGDANLFLRRSVSLGIFSTAWSYNFFSGASFVRNPGKGLSSPSFSGGWKGVSLDSSFPSCSGGTVPHGRCSSYHFGVASLYVMSLVASVKIKRKE